MANCKYCMKKVEDGTSSHVACDELHAHGWTDAQIIAKAAGRYDAQARPSAPTPLSFRHIVIGVWFGGVLAAITVGIFAEIVHDFSH
jgi:hypothetical protein